MQVPTALLTVSASYHSPDPLARRPRHQGTGSRERDAMADDTLAANRTRRPAARVLRALGVGLLWGPQGLAAALRAESGRWPLWVPVFVGFGVAGYFTLATEPPPWVGAAAVAALCPPVWLARRRPALLAAMLALL